MQYLKQWNPKGSGKRTADESNQESLRKRMKINNNDNHGSRESMESAIENDTAIGNGNGNGMEKDQEYRIRGSSDINKDLIIDSSSSLNHSTFSPVATEPRRSSSSVHPDRRDNILNAAHTRTPSPPSLNQREISLTSLPQASERMNNLDSEEQGPEPRHSITHPSLRIDTVRTGSSLDPRSPDISSTMTSYSKDGISRDSPSHDPRLPSGASYRPNSNPSSRRESGNMPPPRHITKITRSDDLASKATSSPTKGESERRQSSNIQIQAPLIDSLTGFAQSITSAASLTVKRDLLKQQAVGQHKEHDRQSKLKSVFLTLVEDSESRAEGTERALGEIDKQIDLSSAAQSKNITTLAARLLKEAELSNSAASAHHADRLMDDVADIKADLESTKKDLGNSRDVRRLKGDTADLKADLKAIGKKVEKLDREAVFTDQLRNKLRGLATRDELRDLVAKDEVRELVTKADSRRIATDEVRKHVTEALVPTEKTLATLTSEDASLRKKIDNAEASIQKYCDAAEEKGQKQSSQFGRLDTSLSDSRMELSRLGVTIQEQQKDFAALKVDIGAQNKVLTALSNCVRLDGSNDVSSLDKVVMKNSEQIASVQKDCEKLDKVIERIQNLEAASKTESSQLSTTSVNTDTKIVEEVKLMKSGFDALKAEQEDISRIRHDLDALKADGQKVGLIRTDLDSLINEEKQKDASVAQGFEEIWIDLKKKYADLTRLQNEIQLVKQSQASRTVSNRPPTPPFANASISPHESYQQRLQDVEMGLGNLTQATQSLELFVNAQQQRFDRLSTDHLVQCMLHQMQLIYPGHPGNLIARQTKVDSYIRGELKDRLNNIDYQFMAQNTRIQEITKIIAEKAIAETRKKLLASINLMKQDIESLKDTAFHNHPHGHSNHGNRIDALVDRVTTVEDKYLQAIADLQETQRDLVRDVTHLQNRKGVGSTRNTPGDPTIIARNSKSAEPSGSTTLSHGNTKNSESCDPPVSVRRDTEDRRPSDPNLKRKAAESDDEKEDEDGEVRPPKAKKVPKRRNVSGKNLFS